MQIQFVPVRKTNSGFAFLATMTFLVVALAIFASIMYLVSSSTKVTASNNSFNMSEAAAEGAAEMAIAQIDRDFLFQTLNPASTYIKSVTNIDQSQWTTKFQFSDSNGVPNQITLSVWPQTWQAQATNVEQLNSSQFPGMFGYTADCTIVAQATPIGATYPTPCTIIEYFQMAGIPVFQFGVFYNMDLDLSNGKPMTMNGKTFVNGNIWMYPQASMTFNDLVEATLLVTNHDNPSDQQNLTTYTTPTYNYSANGGKPKQLCDPVSMPIGGSATVNPTNVEAILNLPPPGLGAPADAAYVASNQMYLYNKCDIIVSNAAAGTNATMGSPFTVYYQDPSCTPYLTKLTNETFTFSNTATHTYIYTTNSPYAWNTTNYIKIASGFPWLTNNTFTDNREGDKIKVVDIDVAAFSTWLQNSAFQGYRWNVQCGGASGTGGDKGHPIDSIYVYNSIPSLAGSPGQLPGVRVVKGAQMPTSKGLTVATPFPLYVLGDYNVQQAAGGPYSKLMTNTANTYPAGLMGDAITILSNGWRDTNTTVNPPASETTVNAACLEGIVPSITVASGTYAGKHYSGGLENFLRLLENWSNHTLCYNGSIVVMFPSIYATNFWQQPGNYYNPPTRQWGFDSNFRYPSGQPPCAPQVKALVRGQWTVLSK
jgi:hypothetical protein